MSYIVLNRNTLGQQCAADPYFQKVIGLCRDWIEGRPFYELRTSGSTGVPKPVQLTRAQMEASARRTGAALDLPAGTRALACLNVDYIGGLMMLVRSMELDWELTVTAPAGNPLLLLPENAGFDFTALVPLQLTDVLVNENTHPRVRKLGKILLGGAGLSIRQTREFGRLEQPVYHGYGMTETVSHVALRRLEPDSGDEAVYEVLEGTDFGVDERGCLYFRSAVTAFEKVQTNDLATLLPGRKFRLEGRADHTINSGGVKIQPESVERKIESLFETRELRPAFFAAAQPDERLGQKLVLVVEGKDDPWLVSQIEEILRSPLFSRYERPKAVYFAENFHKTPSGKTDRLRTLESVLEAKPTANQ